MIVAACPSCRENVTVPIDARPTSIVRCPLCNAEFRLEQFLAQLPPPLIVLTQPDTPSDTATPLADSGILEPVEAHDVVGHDLAEHDHAEHVHAEHDLAIDTGGSLDAGGQLPAFDFTPSATDAVAGPREAARRPATRRSNAPWEIAKIVGGALLAVPAAQIILWWCVPYSWKRDLLHIGPAVSRVAPWIVPAKFRAQVADADEEPSSEGLEDRSTVASPQRPGGRERPWRSKLPTVGDQSGKSAPEPDEVRPGIKLTEDKPPIAPATAIDLDPPLPSGGSSGEPPTEPVPAGAPTAAPNTAAPTPKYSAADLQAALERALQASVAWDTAPNQTPEDRAALTDDFYSTFAALGEAVTFMAPGDPAARDLVADMHHLLASLEQQPKKLVMIGNRAAQWLDQPARPNRGVFLFGTVSQIQAQGDLFTTELELASPQKRTVSIFSRIDPTRFYAPGDHLLMLGAFISDPAQNVPGYEGPAADILFGGFPVRLR